MRSLEKVCHEYLRFRSSPWRGWNELPGDGMMGWKGGEGMDRRNKVWNYEFGNRCDEGETVRGFHSPYLTLLWGLL